MEEKHRLRRLVRENLTAVVEGINRALNGRDTESLGPVLKKIGRGGEIPHWFANLKQNGTLPNLDGKTVGSIVEMLLVAVLETGLLAPEGITLRVNPARGVDLPDLDLGVKSPSENFCTSEPFFSAYERLLGSEHPVVVLVTDYQEKKENPPLRLQIVKSAYLEGSQLADRNLCETAQLLREPLLRENEAWAIKLFKFLAFVNQSDWLAKQLLAALRVMYSGDESVALATILRKAEKDFEKKNAEAMKSDKDGIPPGDLEIVRKLCSVIPPRLAIIDAVDNWVLTNFKDAGRAPNENEWERLKKSPLDGRIGVSAALQWRYNFGILFKEPKAPKAPKVKGVAKIPGKRGRPRKS